MTRLGAEGAIVAPALVTNRRQRDQADREALGELRAGRAAASQAIPSDHGWEHEEATPLATREALAEAVVADVAAHGARTVAVLDVSHADCEDLADRIRSHLVAAGRSPGRRCPARPGAPAPTAPTPLATGCYCTPSPATPACTTARPARWWRWTTTALQWPSTGARQVTLPAECVAGRRGDGNPNVSHAWARTVDGAQGGTWEAVHLLGSANLDALVGYTGQSRRRAPTHTWNTKALAVADHVGLAADERSATEAVLAGLQREPVTTFAAADDPFVLDARLQPSATGTWPRWTPPRPIARPSCARPRRTPARLRGGPNWPPGNWPEPRPASGRAGHWPACAAREVWSGPMPRPRCPTPATAPSGREPAAGRRLGGSPPSASRKPGASPSLGRC